MGKFILLSFLLCACGLLQGQPLMKVEPSADGKNARIQVFPTHEKTRGIVELIDAKSGRCVKTVYAGALASGQAFTLGQVNNLKSGSYRVRYRDGIGVTVDQEITLPKKEKWINPADVVICDKGVYVLDRGFPGKDPEKKDDGTMSEAVPPIGELRVYKFLPDGKPDTTFGDRGRAILSETPAVRPSFTVDNEGIIYLPAPPMHSVTVFDPSGAKMNQILGGYSGDAYSPQSTTCVDNVGIGPGRTIYLLSTWGYGNFRAYDRTKNNFDGLLYGMVIEATGGTPRAMTTDHEGSIYYLTGKRAWQKVDDTGKALKETYGSSSSEKMYFPQGPSASGGLIWVVDHGPAGPFWDSGGDNALLLFWDSGNDIVFVDRYGGPGKAKDKLEFLNPSAVAQTPDHLGLWVVEDGTPIPDGPSGNTRVRTFKITAEHTEEAPLELK